MVIIDIYTCRIDCYRPLERRAYTTAILEQGHSLLQCIHSSIDVIIDIYTCIYVYDYIYGGMVFLHNERDNKSLSCQAIFTRFVCQMSDMTFFLSIFLTGQIVSNWNFPVHLYAYHHKQESLTFNRSPISTNPDTV